MRPDHGVEIEPMHIRVSDLEYSVTRLEDDMTTSQKRLEEMMHSFFFTN